MAGRAGALVTAALLAATLPAGVQASSVPPAEPESAARQSVAAPPGNGDWPQWRATADHAGYNAHDRGLDSSNVENLTLAWHASPGAAVSGGAVVADGVVYAGSQNQHIYAYAADCNEYGGTCTPLWVGNTTGQVFAAPAVVDGLVYVVSRDDHKLYVFAVGCGSGGATCQPLWTTTVPATTDGIDSSPTVAGGVVYVTTHEGHIYAYDAAGSTRCSGTPKTCLPLWQAATTNLITTSVAVGGGYVYVSAYDGVFAYAVGCGSNGATCTPVWHSLSTLGSNSSPTIGEGFVFVGEFGGLVAYAIGCNTGGGTCTPAFTGTIANTVIDSSPAYANGVVYIGANDNKMYAFDANGVANCTAGTCTPLWSTSGPTDVLVSAPTVVNGVVFIGSNDHKLYAYDATGHARCAANVCAPLWSATTGAEVSASPAVAYNTVYIGSYDGGVYAYSLGGDWPQFRQNNSGDGQNSLERTLTADNVKGLKPAWRAQLSAGSSLVGTPVVAHGKVYVTDDNGQLWVFPVSCGHADASGAPADCAPLWRIEVSGAYTSMWSAPTVANGRVYVSSNDGRLYVFDAEGSTGCTGSGTSKICTPLWRTADLGIDSSAPAVANGRVFVGSNGGSFYAFEVAASATYCTAGTPPQCTPMWVASDGTIPYSSPAVANGMVYVASHTGYVFAYPEACNTGGGACNETWKGFTGSVDASPTVAGGVIYQSAPGTLYAFAEGCGTGGATCTPLWTGAGNNMASAAVMDGVVYSIDYDLSTGAWLKAFTIGCATGGAACSPDWIAPLAGSWPEASVAAANGVVYVGTQHGDVAAYAAGCSSGGSACDPAWNYLTGGQVAASPVVAGGALYAVSFDGYLYSFQLEGGIYSTATTYHPIAPARVLDSRPTGSGHTNMGLTGVFTAGTPRTFAVANAPYVGGGVAVAVPVGATAVTGNLTVTGQTNPGVVALGPSIASTGKVTTINFVKGDNRANNVTIGLAPDGTLSAVYRATAGSTVNLIFDVTGYFTPDDTGATYHALTPGRVLDSRPTGSGHTNIGLKGKFANKTVRTFNVAGVTAIGWASALVPSNATAVTANLTVTNATSIGFAAVGPTMTSAPSTSTLNVLKGDNRANGITVKLNAGKLSAVWCGTSGSSADLILDITGYFTADLTGLRYHPLEPARALDTASSIGLAGQFSNRVPRTMSLVSRNGVPIDARGVSGNVTVISPSSAGYVFISPEVVASPTSSTVNSGAGVNGANGMDVPLSGGQVALIWCGTTGSTAHVQLDVTGYWK